MRKIIAVIIVVVITLIGGCRSQSLVSSDAPINQTYQYEEQHSGKKPPHTSLLTSSVTSDNLYYHKNRENPSMAISSYDHEKYNIRPSDIIRGWQELRAEVFLHEMITHRNQKVLSQIADNINIRYSIHIPGDWKLVNTVFQQGKNEKKVAELTPVFLLEKNQKSGIPDFTIPEEYTEQELISRDEVNFGKYHGYRIILKVTDNDTWYPYIYYLTDGTYVFGISLYSYSETRDKFEQILFDDIVSTFKLNA